MKVSVIVKPHARRNAVEIREDGSLLVYVAARPIGGRANEQVIEVLGEYFRKPKRNIVILSGFRARHKIIEVR